MNSQNLQRSLSTDEARLDYAIVIATRNRVDALAISLKSMLNQTRSPQRIIIVDSSDLKEPIAKLIVEVCQRTNVPIELIFSERGTSHQRNVGLGFVEEPVVFFMDDDSLLFPDTAKLVMETYERDTEGRIGGVCTAEAMESPFPVEHSSRVSPRDSLKLKLSGLRRRLENRFLRDPFITLGRNHWNKTEELAWLPEYRVIPVEYMTGFRMTFRTDVIRANQFSEVFEQYGLFEDIDASLRVAQTHLLVGATDAKIYHNRWQGPRSNGKNMGFMQILNRVAIVCRNSAEDSRARKGLTTYTYYKIAQYAIEAVAQRNRDRYDGAVTALKELPRFLRAPSTAVDQIYRDVRQQYRGYQS